MEATGLEEPFWYIIISTGGTFIILATTVLVFGKFQEFAWFELDFSDLPIPAGQKRS